MNNNPVRYNDPTGHALSAGEGGGLYLPSWYSGKDYDLKDPWGWKPYAHLPRAQRPYNARWLNVWTLAKMAVGESGNVFEQQQVEDYKFTTSIAMNRYKNPGQRWVGQTVWQIASDEEFRGFSWTDDGSNSVTPDALQVASDVLDGKVPDPTHGARYFVDDTKMRKPGHTDEESLKQMVGALMADPEGFTAMIVHDRSSNPVEDKRCGCKRYSVGHYAYDRFDHVQAVIGRFWE